MKRDATQEVDRRTWLAGCARTVVLGGIAVASGVLVRRGQVRGCPARDACVRVLPGIVALRLAPRCRCP